MFAGALLDLRPDLADGAIAAVRAAGLDPAVALAHVPFSDGTLSGSRFDVRLPETAGDGHAHVHWSSLRTRLEAAPLDAPVRDRAIAIFAVLAEAEARVHDKPVDDVAFHEVGAWDSIADIVAAAWLIDALGPATWSVGALPAGSGRVPSAHGLLPVPAPATVLLLEGFPVFDDGRPGERVTPTGAAILRHLAPARGPGRTPRVLSGTGYGFGTKRFEGLSNVLRVLAYAPAAGHDDVQSDTVTRLAFEVDDQTPEDLALALERLRIVDGVLDVCQFGGVGKQGRTVAAVRVLATPEASERAVRACFEETTTLGVRITEVDRRVLARRGVEAEGIGVKIAARPGGATAKAELADLAGAGVHRDRQARRGAAERAALGRDADD